jgi:hypothetical protein
VLGQDLIKQEEAIQEAKKELIDMVPLYKPPIISQHSDSALDEIAVDNAPKIDIVQSDDRQVWICIDLKNGDQIFLTLYTAYETIKSEIKVDRK